MSRNSRITADPIMGVIAAHRRHYMAFLAADAETAQSAYEVEKEALNRLLRTKPTTLTGAAVLLRYVLRHNEEERGRLTDRFSRRTTTTCWTSSKRSPTGLRPWPQAQVGRHRRGLRLFPSRWAEGGPPEPR